MIEDTEWNPFFRYACGIRFIGDCDQRPIGKCLRVHHKHLNGILQWKENINQLGFPLIPNARFHVSCLYHVRRSPTWFTCFLTVTSNLIICSHYENDGADTTLEWLNHFQLCEVPSFCKLIFFKRPFNVRLVWLFIFSVLIVMLCLNMSGYF